jgi:hypothetical protein
MPCIIVGLEDVGSNPKCETPLLCANPPQMTVNGAFDGFPLPVFQLSFAIFAGLFQCNLLKAR